MIILCRKLYCLYKSWRSADSEGEDEGGGGGGGGGGGNGGGVVHGKSGGGDPVRENITTRVLSHFIINN